MVDVLKREPPAALQSTAGSTDRVSRPTALRRTLIVGVGNILRMDDGFGPAVIRALEQGPALPPNVRLVEMGIGGVNLVLELLDGYDILIVVDAVDRQGPPGSLYLLEPELPDLNQLTEMERRELASDTHQAVPGRTFILAAALGVLPPVVRLVGCQPVETDTFSMELSPTVQAVVPAAVEMILTLVGGTNE